jgi:plastocyanin
MNAARRIGFAVVAVITVAVAVFAIARGVSTDTGSSTPSAAGGSGGGGQPVDIKSFTFNPDSITVKAGSKVTWTNSDPTRHSIKSQNGQFVGSHDLSQGQTFTATFSTPGTYQYVCGIHNFMTGTIVVQG